MSNYYGQFMTDKIINERYFGENYIGNCIEVGAVDGIDLSNTYFFEKLGWNCMCIEPQPGTGYFDSLKLNRKLALNYAISSEEREDILFTIIYMKRPWEKNYNQSNAISGLSIDERLIEQHLNMGFQIAAQQIPVKTKTLEWCIKNHFDKETIDFISIDVEGTELDVLKSFDVNAYNTKLLVIENNFNDPEIESYLKEMGWRKDIRVEVNDFYIK